MSPLVMRDQILMSVSLTPIRMSALIHHGILEPVLIE